MIAITYSDFNQHYISLSNTDSSIWCFNFQIWYSHLHAHLRVQFSKTVPLPGFRSTVGNGGRGSLLEGVGRSAGGIGGRAPLPTLTELPSPEEKLALPLLAKRGSLSTTSSVQPRTHRPYTAILTLTYN